MKENTKNTLLWIFGGATLLCIGGVVYTSIEAHNMRKLISQSADHIRGLSQVDIDQQLVDKMVAKSVREQANNVCRESANKIQHDVFADMRNRVKQAVANQTNNISQKVAKTIAEEISETDKDEIIEEVISATTEKLTDKLGEELDAEVGRIGKIYKGIAAALGD